ncbi:hypothetical protein C8F04DRAFT_1400851 [Mycena alexandri]|uniref:Uncharacterized protein n=1 Tax=Mycena alexandri TaxID=1745969 RepID=A0AAD6WXM6_9AGAR|nr:hypothetical protein C8F04DRAFT_1400851 [Mycena alexandri]
MSATKKPMLSFTAAIFRGLQEDLRTTIGTPSVLRNGNGLLEAHRKLSDYYYKFDQPPYYTRAARIIYSIPGFPTMDFAPMTTLLITRKLRRSDYSNTTLTDMHHANKTPVRAPCPAQPSSSQQMSSPQKDFAARYRGR